MMRYPVLIVDDDEFICEDIALALDKNCFDVDTSCNPAEAFTLFREKKHVIVISDICIPDDDGGFELLDKIKSSSPDTAVVMITMYGDMQRATRAMQRGACDVITKPFESEQIAIKVRKLAERVALISENRRLRKELKVVGSR